MPDPALARLPAWLRLMRPWQWPKNLLAALPCLAAHRFDAATLGRTGLAILALCLAASAIYALNDLRDAGHDRQHPEKRHRPVAAREVPPGRALVLAVALALAALAVARTEGWALVAGIAAYLALAAAYALALRGLALADMIALAALYALRAVIGGVATGIAASVWLLAFLLFFFFALAALKRQAQVLAQGLAQGGAVLGGAILGGAVPGRAYGAADAPSLAGMALASGHAAVVVLVLYLNSDEVRLAYAWPAPLWGACLIVLYWINRACLLTARGRMPEDPVAFALRDPVTWACLAAIGALAALAA